MFDDGVVAASVASVAGSVTTGLLSLSLGDLKSGGSGGRDLMSVMWLMCLSIAAGSGGFSALCLMEAGAGS